MNTWVGVLTGNGRTAYLASTGFVRVVDRLGEATLYQNPSVALIEAQGQQAMRDWVTDISIEPVTVTIKYVAIGYDAEHMKRYLRIDRALVETSSEATIFDDHDSAMHLANQAVNDSWSQLQSGDEGQPRPPRITHGGVEEVEWKTIG